MAEYSTKNVRRIKKDIISELPSNIQETILSFLPLRDAVRTSILSRKWRHCWTMVPDLVFDEEIFGRTFYNSSQCHDPELKTLKFVRVIDKVLLLHNGPILKFSLSCPQFRCSARIIHHYINQWIPLFSRKGIKQLTIEDSYYKECVAHNISSLDLTHLRLANVWFPYTPASGGLTYLTNLELVGVATTEQSIFDCPVLEKLTLFVCKGLSHTNFRAPNLKCLHQYYRQMTSEYSLAGLGNLTEFSFRLSYDPELQLQTATSNVVKVLASLRKIEKFSIAKGFITYLAAGGSPNRLPEPLPYLKALNISDIDFTELSEVSCLLCLIRSAPNLRTLHISADLKDREGNLKNSWIEDCALDHLEIVTFSYFKGLKAELELVKFLLAHSPSLKTMFIHRVWYMEKDVAFKMLEEMLEFSRASSRAQIRNLECPFDADDFGPWVNRFDII